MKSSIAIRLFVGILLLLSLTRCNNAENSMSPLSGESNSARGTQTADQYLPMLADTAFTTHNKDSSFTGQDGLLYMREEEKLAHDVYLYLNTKWNQKVFANITTSEQRHVDAMKYLLSIYNVADPVINEIPGQFVNSHLQDLYNQLISAGSVSLVEALKVGAAIEEIDILDIKKEIAADSKYTDITGVYTNLMSASENHLRAFVRNLSRQGVTYQPQYLTAQEYAAIIN